MSAPLSKTKSGGAAKKVGDPSTPLPISRVNRIIKADKDVRLCSKEAIFLISKATEHFLARLTKQAYAQARLQKRDKSIKYADMSNAIVGRPEWFFLTEVIPPVLPLSVALKKRALVGDPTSLPVEDENHPYHLSSNANSMLDVGGTITGNGGVKKRRTVVKKPQGLEKESEEKGMEVDG